MIRPPKTAAPPSHKTSFMGRLIPKAGLHGERENGGKNIAADHLKGAEQGEAGGR
jgi:hypothetical protein